MAISAQQLEWYNTVLPKGALSNNAVNSGKVSVTNNKIILASLTPSRSLGIEGEDSIVLTASNLLPDAYFLGFDSKGVLQNSQIIHTPNGYDHYPVVFQNKANNFIYVSFITSSDSVRFTASMPWIRVNRKNINTYNSFMVIYDDAFNYVTHITFASYNGCQVNIKAIDNAGNLYLGGTFRDSLMLNNQLLLKNNSIYSSSFIMKMDDTHKVNWINESLGHFILNETRSSFYAIGGIGKNSAGVIKFNSTDSLIFSPDPNHRTIIAEFTSELGRLKQYTTLFDGTGNLFSISEFKGNDKYLLLNRNNTSSGPIKLKIGNDSFSFKLGLSPYWNNFIMGFNASNLKNVFVNFFDSSAFQLSITDIYNDSLYSMLGTTMGNQNFSFTGKPVYTKDHIKSRPAQYQSDFFATYTAGNRLKDLWYLTTHPSLMSRTFNDVNQSIAAHNNTIYIVGSIPYHSDLGLGKHEFNYSAGNTRSLTLLKYNCKPTAWFSYTQINNKVNFKNLSTGMINYKWLFGKDNDMATTNDAVYEYPKLNNALVYNPKLIASNSCGSDTFTLSINIGTTSVSMLDKAYISIYPNPASTKINVEFDMEPNSKKVQFNLHDICGKTFDCPVTKISGTQYQLNVQVLSNGIYSLSVNYEGLCLYQKVTILK
jgi:hypothetical protein